MDLAAQLAATMGALARSNRWPERLPEPDLPEKSIPALTKRYGVPVPVDALHRICSMSAWKDAGGHWHCEEADRMRSDLKMADLSRWRDSERRMREDRMAAEWEVSHGQGRHAA